MYGILASLGGKIGAGALAALIVGGAIWAYNDRQQTIGENRVEARHAESVQEQTNRVKATDTKLDDQRLQAVERASAKKDAFNARLIQSNRAYAAENARLKLAAAQAPTHEVIHDLERPEAIPLVCVVPDRLIDRVDELGGMLNQLSGDRVPGDPGAATQSEAKDNGPVTCDALVHRIEVLTSRLGNTLTDHTELWAYTWNQYMVYHQFKNGLKE